jgi:hypothetical protein
MQVKKAMMRRKVVVASVGNMKRIISTDLDG